MGRRQILRVGAAIRICQYVFVFLGTGELLLQLSLFQVATKDETHPPTPTAKISTKNEVQHSFLTDVDPRPSRVHCVGENFLENTWKFKSCHFQNLCFDTKQNEFVLFKDESFQPHGSKTAPEFPTQLSANARSSTSFYNQTGVSLGPLVKNRPKLQTRQQRTPFFPSVRWLRKYAKRRYLMLPENAVWVPFTTNLSPEVTPSVRDVLFDYVFPIYNLAAMFGLQESLLLLSTLDYGEHMSGSAVLAKDVHTSEAFQPYLPMIKRFTWRQQSHLNTTQQTVQDLLVASSFSTKDHPFVCARHALVGLGPLTDHGVKRGHGEYIDDYQFSQNVGRGPLLSKFRDYVLQNARVSETLNETLGSGALVHAFVSNMSAFSREFEHLQLSLPKFSVQSVDTKTPWKEQIEMLQQANLMISAAGDDAIPAFFLPQGSTVVLYFDDGPGNKIGRNRNRAITLDWDLWNHMSHIDVHWIPMSSVGSPKGLNALLQIVKLMLEATELESDMRQRVHADATLNREPLVYVPHSPTSFVNCIGDNFVRKEAPCYRSCRMRNICMDLKTREMVLFASETQIRAESAMETLADGGFAMFSSSMKTSIMEGRNIRISSNKPWFPTLRQSNSSMEKGYFLLPPDVFLVPSSFDASYASNPGHLIWDLFLPFYYLLSMFEKDNGTKRLLLVDMDDTCKTQCRNLVNKFLPLIGVKPDELFTIHSEELEVSGNAHGQSNVVCAKNGASGIGMLTDHGASRHGQNYNDYARVHNSGRGATFHQFRLFMLKNLGIRSPQHCTQKIVFSIHSTNNSFRRKSFTKQIKAVKAVVGERVAVEVVELATISLHEQARIVADAAVFVSVAGGSTSIATLLPRGASVVLYFCTEISFVGNTKKKEFPTMLDFDFWNNASHLRIHWLPTGPMDEASNIRFLANIILSALRDR